MPSRVCSMARTPVVEERFAINLRTECHLTERRGPGQAVWKCGNDRRIEVMAR